MCGGAILANLTKQPGTRRLTERALWPEKKKAKRGGGGGRRYPAGFVEEDDDDFEADFEEFEVNSGESDLELGQEDDDDVVEIKPFATKRNFSGGIAVALVWAVWSSFCTRMQFSYLIDMRDWNLGVD